MAFTKIVSRYNGLNTSKWGSNVFTANCSVVMIQYILCIFEFYILAAYYKKFSLEAAHTLFENHLLIKKFLIDHELMFILYSKITFQ